MGFEATHNCIRNKFKVDLVTSGVFAASEVAWDNDGYDDQTTGEAAQWVRFQILTNESLLRNLGGSVARTQGIALASVFVLAGNGDNLALSLVDSIVSAFRATNHTFGGAQVTFRTPSVRRIGRDGAWWQMNVAIPFFTESA